MVAPAEAFVVDACVAAKWYLLDETDVDRALLLLDSFDRGQTRLAAPDSIRLEVASSITAATRGREPRLTQAEGRAAIAAFLVLGLETAATETLIAAAYDLVLRYDCAIYDAIYLALAQQIDLPFITADYKLYRKIRDLPEVLWITQYPAATA